MNIYNGVTILITGLIMQLKHPTRQKYSNIFIVYSIEI